MPPNSLFSSITTQQQSSINNQSLPNNLPGTNLNLSQTQQPSSSSVLPGSSLANNPMTVPSLKIGQMHQQQQQQQQLLQQQSSQVSQNMAVNSQINDSKTNQLIGGYPMNPNMRLGNMLGINNASNGTNPSNNNMQMDKNHSMNNMNSMLPQLNSMNDKSVMNMMSNFDDPLEQSLASLEQPMGCKLHSRNLFECHLAEWQIKNDFWFHLCVILFLKIRF